MSRPPLKQDIAPSSPDMSNASTVPVTPAQLKTFLTEAPLMYKSKLHKGAEKHILTNCYRSLWSNDLDLMQKYFFKEGLSDSDNLSQLLEKYNLFGSEEQEHDEQHHNQQNLSKNDDDEPEYWESQRGKQCGHLFKKGESVYRCRYNKKKKILTNYAKNTPFYLIYIEIVGLMIHALCAPSASILPIMKIMT